MGEYVRQASLYGKEVLAKAQPASYIMPSGKDHCLPDTLRLD